MDLKEVLTTHSQIAVDRTLLTGDQIKELDRWEQFFHGPIWRDLVNRYEPRIHALQGSYHRVVGEQQLGQVQGALNAYYDVFEHLPDLIHLEFLMKTGQVTQDGPSNEDLVFPGNADA